MKTNDDLFTCVCGLLINNVYLLVVDGKGIVIDPTRGSFQKIQEHAEKNDITLSLVILTHSHWDHIGDAYLFHEAGCRVAIHKEDAETFMHPGSDMLPCPISLTPFSPDHLLEDGEIIESLKVLHTPGHSPGSICLYDEKNTRLFSGDTLFYKAIGAISFPTSEPLRMQQSLQKLAQLPPDTIVYPGHGRTTTISKEKNFFKSEKFALSYPSKEPLDNI